MIEFEQVSAVPRLLLQAELRPVQGSRFQPTGFPDIGAAEYERPNPDGSRTPMLLVESTQSMANRLEAVCWDEARDALAPQLQGLPYVRVDAQGLGKSSSVLEFHRLNSPYILGDENFNAKLRQELGMSEKKAGEEDVPGALDLRRLARVVFKYDPGSVLHGVFLEKIAGRMRLQRLLSAFIEAEEVERVESGGVKFDRLDPTGRASGSAKEGFGNVPHHRVEYSALHIVAYFNLDLATLRGYGLEQPAEQLLIALALWKVRRFLATGLRLRTACDLEVVGEPRVTRPANYELPKEDWLTKALPDVIAECRSLFPDQPVTEVQFGAGKKKK